jgi:hypothetical protein
MAERFEMRTAIDELALWQPSRAALLVIASVLTPAQRRKLDAKFLGLARLREEAGDILTANYLRDLASGQPLRQKPALRLIVSN